MIFVRKIFFISCFFCYNLYGINLPTQNWENHVILPRSEHNFLLFIQKTSGIWDIQKTKIRKEQIYHLFQYSYFIPSWKNFSFFLGSHFGLGWSIDLFETSIRYPGFITGLTFDLNPQIRLGTSFACSFEQFQDLKFPDKEKKDLKIEPVVEMYDYIFFIDWFYNLNWAVHIEYGIQSSHSSFEVEVQDKKVNIELNQPSRFFSLGLVYHLL